MGQQSAARIRAMVRDAIQQHRAGNYPLLRADLAALIEDYERRGLWHLAAIVRDAMHADIE